MDPISIVLGTVAVGLAVLWIAGVILGIVWDYEGRQEDVIESMEL